MSDVNVYSLTDDEYEYRGAIGSNGEITDGEESSQVQMVAGDLARLSVSQVLNLYHGPSPLAVDMREWEEIPEGEQEELKERKSYQKLRARMDNVVEGKLLEKQLEKENIGLLKSHPNPVPIVKLKNAVSEACPNEWFREWSKTCETNAEKRRMVAESEYCVDVIDEIVN